MPDNSKMEEIRKSSKQPLTPPLIFGKSYCNFSEICDRRNCLKITNHQKMGLLHENIARIANAVQCHN